MTEPEFHDPSHDPHLEELIWDERFKPGYFYELAGRRISPPPFLFENLIYTNSLIMLSGEPFSGKTLLMLNLLLSLDLGLPLFGEYLPSPYQRTLFIGQDAATWDYYAQYLKLYRGYVGDKTEPPTMKSMYFFNKGISLQDPSFFPWLQEAVRIWGFNVLMLDTLLEFHDADENSNKEMKPVMRVLKDARDKLGMTVLFSHHTGKPGPGARSGNYRARGASCISGGVDQHILISGRKNGFAFLDPKGRGLSRKGPQDVLFEEKSLSRGISLSLLLDPTKTLEALGKRESTILACVTQPRTRAEIKSALASAFPGWTPDELSRRTSTSLRYLTIVKPRLTRLDRGLYGPLETK